MVADKLVLPLLKPQKTIHHFKSWSVCSNYRHGLTIEPTLESDLPNQSLDPIQIGYDMVGVAGLASINISRLNHYKCDELKINGD